MMLPLPADQHENDPSLHHSAELHPEPVAAENRAQVLIVEDDPAMARMIAAALASIYRISIANDGQEGLEQVMALHPDLLLCDIAMPRMSGEQLVKALRACQDFDDMPIVILSGSADAQRRVQLLRGGAQDYLVKPFNREELRARVVNLSTIRQARLVLQQEVKQQNRDLVALANEVTLRQRELTHAHSLLQDRETRLQDQLKERAIWSQELEQANGELRRQRDVLIALNKALEEAHRGRQFFSTMSHELRTPLASIIGFSQLLLADAHQAHWDQQHVDNLERILKNGQHLLSLINDVLDLVKIEAGRMEVTFAEVDVRELLTWVVEETQSLAISRKLALRTEVEEGADALESNLVKLRQILLNLVSNALKFTEQGGVTVSARQAGTGHLAFSVEDTGIGIPADLQEHIFEAFYQVDAGYRRKAGGTGLGLAIVSELTALLGGRIELISASGRGSTFTVILPIKAVHQVDEQDPLDTARSTRALLARRQTLNKRPLA